MKYFLKIKKQKESGRSMVEMLGVLAIIGVLSVGGVYGYGVAMKKHKANEALHKASLLATTVSAYAMTNDGNLPPSITDFGSASNGTFETTVGETADKKQFILTVKDLDDGVCEQLQNLTGGIVQKIECKDAANGKKNALLMFYKDLSTQSGNQQEQEELKSCQQECEEPNRCLPNGEI